MRKLNNNDLLQELQKKQYGFGQSLRTIRENQGLTIHKVANEVKKTSTYISDIERGNNKPPGVKLMAEIVKALNMQETEIESYLYDLAAKERGGVSGDIADYIMGNSNLRMAIRIAQRKNNGDTCKGDEFWAECLSKIQTQ